MIKNLLKICVLMVLLMNWHVAAEEANKDFPTIRNRTSTPVPLWDIEVVQQNEPPMTAPPSNEQLQEALLNNIRLLQLYANRGIIT